MIIHIEPGKAMRVLLRCAATVMLLGGTMLATAPGSRADEGEELAKKLSNPVAALISVPFQFNYDQGYGSDDGWKGFVNVQPVIPISISTDWNLISRTILPIATQDDIAGPSGHQTGLGDVTQSLFFSPKAPTSGGLIWGVGPVILLPTATDELLGSDKWGLGPTGVVLTQKGPWTIGMLGNHVWSVAGNDGRKNISSTFMQPFIAYTTPDAWTYGLNTESTYNWNAEEWSVPLNLTVAKLIKVGKQPISLQAGLRYWADSPDSGPDGIGARFAITFLFPK